ncbi:hypothetical protein [Amycolatopsis sp. CA-230715]|nr:hypothetical protein [Amycolatopsis sp. CA-230715]
MDVVEDGPLIHDHGERGGVGERAGRDVEQRVRRGARRVNRRSAW